MTIDIPYPDTDYKPGDARRTWGSLTTEVESLEAFLDAEVAAGRITEGERRYMESATGSDVRRAHAYATAFSK